MRTCPSPAAFAAPPKPSRWVAGLLATALLHLAGALEGTSLAQDDPRAGLAERIASSDRDERLEAIRQAARTPAAARGVVPQLIDALKADDLSVRYEAASALGAIGPEAAAAVGPLSKLLEADLDLLRYAAASALRQIAEGGNEQVVQRLLKVAVEDPTLDVRVAAARAVATLSGEEAAAANRPEVVQVLVSGLASDDDHVSSDAIHGLAASGGGATEAILPLLKAKQDVSRANAADALVVLGLSARSATPALIEALQSSGADSTRHLLRALAAVGSDPEVAIPAILKVLEATESDETRMTALRTLGEFEAGAGPAVPAVLDQLKSEDLRLKAEAVETLGEIGPAASAAVPALVELLQGDDGLVTITAAHALSRIGKPAAAPLQTLLNEPGYQLLAATILGDIGPDATAAVPDLVKLVDHEDEEVRRAALLALAGIGAGAAGAVDRLLAVLNDPQSTARAGAAYALARIGARDAVDDLQRILAESDDERLKMTAGWALVILAPETADAEQIVPALVAGLDDPWDLVRRECVTALATLGPRARSAADRLAPLLDDPDPLVRAETLVALQRVGADVEQLLPRLIEGLNDETLDTRYACAYVLGQLGQRARPSIPQLKELLNHRRQFDRIVAAWALAKIDPGPATREAAVPLMIMALTDSSEQVRREAALTLGLLGDRSPAVLEALRAAAEDASPRVQQAARESLQQLTGA